MSKTKDKHVSKTKDKHVTKTKDKHVTKTKDKGAQIEHEQIQKTREL